MPSYNGDPKRDQNFDNPHFLKVLYIESLQQARALHGLASATGRLEAPWLQRKSGFGGLGSGFGFKGLGLHTRIHKVYLEGQGDFVSR